MDKYSVCADFLPGINEETLDTSFIHEAIRNYSANTNDLILEESIKEIASGLLDKIKNLGKSVWKKMKGAGESLLAFLSIGSSKGRKPPKATSGKINEATASTYPQPDYVGKSGNDYIRGLIVACATIDRNIVTYRKISEAAAKAFNEIASSKKTEKALSEFRKAVDAINAEHSEAFSKIEKQYNFRSKNKKGDTVSSMAVAAFLMSEDAKRSLSPKNAGKYAEVITKHWNKLIPAFNDTWNYSMTENSEVVKSRDAAKRAIVEDKQDVINTISSCMYKVATYMEYVRDDLYYVADRINAGLWAVNAKVQPKESTNESIGPRSVYYRLGESEVYKYCRNQETVDGAKLESNITRMVRDGYGFTFVNYDDLDKTVQYEIFESNQYFNVGVSGAKKAVKNLLMSGKVQMVYSDTYMVDVSIPYIITTGRNPKVFVNISHFVNPNQFGKYVITQVRNKNALISALFAACVSYAIVSHYHTLNPDIGDPLVLMHAYMLTDVFDRMVHMDAIMKDKVRYLCTQFALVQMYGTEMGTKTFQRFRGKYFPKLSNMLMNSVDSQFTVDAFDNIQVFIDELVRVYPSMKKVTFKDVWKTWYRRYSNTAIMVLDYIGYMIYVLCELLYESPLINRLALDPMLKAARGELALKTLQTMVASVG